MRIVHLTPGTGSFHCGSCLRDNALIKALRVRKHDAIMVPLYLPLVTDNLAANPEIDIQVGGVSLYLAQKMPWTRHLPRFIHRWLNSPDRLRNASKKMGMTAAATLGEMTLGSLQGKDSTQWSEWQRLIDWLKTQPKPDVISLSNSLLCGLVPALAEEFPGAKIVVSLQGEDSFLDTLPEPYKEQCWDALRAIARKVTLFVSPSQFYADLINKRLGLDGSQMRVVPNGMDLHSFPTADPDPNFPTIGYFARMIHGKGLTMVVDAFIALAKKGTVPRLKLRIGGAYTAADEEYVNGLKQKIADAGLTQRVEWLPNVSFNEKVRFFRELSVFSVPATYGEAFGLYVIEAMASGVPVVQPDHGAFPEIIAATKGGVLCKPDDLDSLTSALEDLLIDHNKRDQLANDGIPRVRDEYSATKMAERFEAILQ
ncbi:MAG: glycosyltransferase family 4 protein [Verrucomicrobiaceae bacterium]|nr:glycosyltransferase family 4 protein [Verrucomicrobiaceae bacterium]